MTALAAFLDEALSKSNSENIPTGIICASPDASSHTSIIAQLSQNQSNQGSRTFLSLSANSAANLKALLKGLIQKATARDDGIDDDDDDDRPTRGKGAKLLNYDLQILAEHVRERKLDQVVIAIQDIEAFDSDLLSELIELLGCWQGRIPFAFLFSIATSLGFLQQRLSKEAVKCLQGRLFDVAPSTDEVEQVFEAVTNQDTPLWIGPGLMAMALERQSDCIQSIDGFVGAVKYAYMSCYYANALSIFLDPCTKFDEVPNDHFEAIRNLQSFRRFCRQLLEDDEAARVRDMLDSDAILFGLVRQKIREGREALADMMVATNMVWELQRCVLASQIMPKSKFYGLAMSNRLNGSSIARSLLLAIRKAPSNHAAEFMKAVLTLGLPEDIEERCISLKDGLVEMIKDQAEPDQPLRSEDDVKNSTLRTTVVAQKVELSKQKSSVSKQDAAYTTTLRKFTDLIEEFFNDKFIDPKGLLFHEIFLYDLKSPNREVFTPRPRHAIERALVAPHDYLDCDCCAPGKDDGDEATLSASQPATAVLYQLYLESGSLINASDLWQAFQAVAGDERTDGQNLALFQRALAELQYMGLVKSTRKRVDHVAKVAWRGL